MVDVITNVEKVILEIRRITIVSLVVTLKEVVRMYIILRIVPDVQIRNYQEQISVTKNVLKEQYGQCLRLIGDATLVIGGHVSFMHRIVQKNVAMITMCTTMFVSPSKPKSPPFQRGFFDLYFMKSTKSLQYFSLPFYVSNIFCFSFSYSALEIIPFFFKEYNFSN